MGAQSDTEPWRRLPARVADVIEPEVPDLTAELLATIGREVPEYARPLEGEFGRGIRGGVAEALRQFIGLIRDPDAGRGPGSEVYVGLGRGEMRQGRRLDSLLSAYRTGARVAWRRCAEAGRRAGLEPEVLYLLAESIFAYIDELSAESAAGYAEEQSAREGVRERARRRLLAVLTSDRPDAGELGRAAAEAGWTVPGTVAALACPVEDLPGLGRRLPADCVGSTVGGIGCLAVPDPDGPGRRELAVEAVGDRAAALGPSASPSEFARSWRTAAAALGALQPRGLLVAEEHLFELLLAENRPRLRRIAGRRLAGLEPLTEASRERMLETLVASLRSGGDVRAMAAVLHVHPQTVRYRLGRLRELLGDQLDDTDARLELHAALRAGCLEPTGPASA